jgi:hypothetical protein
MEMEDLRQQLQLLKKQAMTTLDQERKSSECEQAALLQAQESANLEQAATLEATRAVEHESYMIELMTTTSQDVVGTHLFPNYLTRKILSNSYLLYCFPFCTGSSLDAAAEEKRVNLRVGVLMRLAAEANVDFWVDETRCRAIVQFQDRATQAHEFIVSGFGNLLGDQVRIATTYDLLDANLLGDAKSMK